MFEDAPSGVEAARTSGMEVIAVPDPAMGREHFTDASEVLNSLEEFDLAKWIVN